MNAEELYQAIKKALEVFGLSWGDKEKVIILMEGFKFRYRHEEYTVNKKKGAS